MANLLYQQIEMLSREKHIEPEVVISAIEDAMVVAARKFYKTEEDLRGKFNAETGRSEEHTSELQSRQYLVCRLLLEKKTTSPARRGRRFLPRKHENSCLWSRSSSF